MRWIAPLVAAALCMGAAVEAQAAPKTAVVDLVQLMDKHPETAKLEKQFQDARKLAQDKLKGQEQRLEEIKQEIQALNKENPRRRSKEHEFESLRIITKFNFEWEMQGAMEAYVKGLENAYAAVLAEVKRYSEENSIELVLLRTDPLQPLSAGDLSDFGIKTRLRVVLYAASPLDITSEVLKRPAFAAVR